MAAAMLLPLAGSLIQGALSGQQNQAPPKPESSDGIKDLMKKMIGMGPEGQNGTSTSNPLNMLGGGGGSGIGKTVLGMLGGMFS